MRFKLKSGYFYVDMYVEYLCVYLGGIKGVMLCYVTLNSSYNCNEEKKIPSEFTLSTKTFFEGIKKKMMMRGRSPLMP